MANSSARQNPESFNTSLEINTVASSIATVSEDNSRRRNGSNGAELFLRYD